MYYTVLVSRKEGYRTIWEIASNRVYIRRLTVLTAITTTTYIGVTTALSNTGTATLASQFTRSSIRFTIGASTAKSTGIFCHHISRVVAGTKKISSPRYKYRGVSFIVDSETRTANHVLLKTLDEGPVTEQRLYPRQCCAGSISAGSAGTLVRLH
jgi:hypothetical protein